MTLNWEEIMQILYYLENLRTPFLDTFFGWVTYLGDEVVFILVGLVIFWCISKRWGYYLFTVGFFSTLIFEFLKITCQVPRPWVRDPGFTIVESARGRAGDFSFPSGHAAMSTAIYGCSARFTKSKAIRTTCIVLIAIICFSRLYLGVHYPTDVCFSLAYVLVLVFLFYPVFRKRGEFAPIYLYFATALTILCLVFAFFLKLHNWPEEMDPDCFAETAKTSYMLVGCGAAYLLSLLLDLKRKPFDVHAPWWAQILKVAIGIGIIFGIKEGLKPLLAALFGTQYFTNTLRYFCMVAFATCVWPLTFPWFSAGCPLRKKS